MKPSITGHTLNDQLTFRIALTTDRATTLTSTGPTLGIRVLPGAIRSRLAAATLLANCTPLALPIAVRNESQRWIKAIGVIRNVAIVAEDQTGVVIALAATFANGAIQAAPALLEDHLGHFDVDAVGVVALATLGARNQAAFVIGPNCAAHHANVLSEDEFVLSRAQNQAVFIIAVVARILAGIRGWFLQGNARDAEKAQG